jgi:hypothetical protein
MRTTRQISPDDQYDGADPVPRFAAKNGISRSQAYNLLREGKVIGRKIGKRTVITHADAAKWRRKLPRAHFKPLPHNDGQKTRAVAGRAPLALQQPQRKRDEQTSALGTK